MIDVPYGYRLLGVGETISQGDLYRHCDGEWRECVHTINNLVDAEADDTFARKLPVAIKAQEYSTGAKRSDSTGRGRFDLIPYEAMLSLAKRYEMGADVFGDRNWEKGQPLSRLLSSMRRHAMQINYDFSEDHVGAVLWNAAAFVTIVERVRAGILPKELDDIGYLERLK